MFSSVGYDWAVTHYTGDKAKVVLSHAEVGLGYKILERPDKGSSWVLAAYKKPRDGKLISDNTKILDANDDAMLIKKLENK